MFVDAVIAAAVVLSIDAAVALFADAGVFFVGGLIAESVCAGVDMLDGLFNRNGCDKPH